MVFVQPNNSKKSMDLRQTPAPVQNNFEYLKAPPLDRTEDGVLIPQDDERQGLMFKEMTDAIRCVKISPDGKTLACGDWLGNIRIYDLTNPESIAQ